MNTLREDEQIINGELCYRVAPGQWRPYRGQELTERIRQLSDDNPAGSFKEDDK